MMEAPNTPVSFDDLPAVTPGSTWSTEWWIAWGHFRSRKTDAFLNVVTLFSIIGVVAGVALLNWVLGVMTGFEVDLRDKILGANAHAVVMRYGGDVAEPDRLIETMESIDGVKGAAPFIFREMMLQSDFAPAGAILKGVDPVRTGAVTDVQRQLTVGPKRQSLETDAAKLEAFMALGELIEPPPLPAGFERGEDEDIKPYPGILLGTDLARNLQVKPGDRLRLINPLGNGKRGPLGMPVPQYKMLRVAGIFESGMFEYNSKWTYVANETLQDFLKMDDKVTGIEVALEDIDEARNICAAYHNQVGYPYFCKSWQDMNQSLFAALELEKWVMGLILQMVTMIAGLLIITTLYMLVLTKGREIAILKAMGASNSMVLRIFVMEGAFIGILGTSIGTVLGLVGCEFLRRYEYPLETDVYSLNTLPVVVEPINVVLIAVSTLAICFVCTLYPAWRAARLDPVEALRYE